MDKIRKIFFENPEKEFHVRQIAKIISRSPTTTSNYLKKLHKENFLLKKEERNHLLFKANNENQEYKDSKVFYNIINLRKLVEHLEKEFNHPEAIILYGSFSKGEDSENSDIDITIMTSLKKEINLVEYEKKLKKNIHLNLISRKMLENMKCENKELLNNILNGITMSGQIEVFK